ncbi:MAG: hypothetical protein ACK4RK_16575 [Gemmataceae bacterium]
MAYEQVLAQSWCLQYLGLPRDWSVVEKGFHPFSPERVVILTSDHHLKLGRTLTDAKKQIWSRIEAWFVSIRGPLMPPAKFDLLLAFVDHMAAYYQRPDLEEYWAFRLTQREQLGSCGLGRGFGLVHQFQLDDVVKTTNGKVDWWLFLLPEGANYESLDDKPVHLLIGHVFDQRRIGLEYRVWELTARLARRSFGQPDNADGISFSLLEVANMDRISAARFLNYQLALCLNEDKKQ